MPIAILRPSLVSTPISEEIDFPANVSFFKTFNFPVTINFVNTNQFSIPAYIFMGNLYKDTNATVNFLSSNQKDFNASIQIQQVSVQVNTSNTNESNFSAKITIANPYLGAGGINITLSNGSVVSNVITDATGFFEFINLSPGSYTVTPNTEGIYFTPAIANVKITNYNVQLYFNAFGSTLNLVQTNSSLPENTELCFINQAEGNSGTFSIEGFINLEDNSTYTNILTIITNESIASKFRETLG